MAIVELAGNSIGSATCIGSMVLIVPVAGGSIGQATCSAQLVLVVKASGSAVAAATCTGSLVLIKTSGGAAVGKATTELGPVRLYAVFSGSAYGSASGVAYVADRDVYADIRSILPDVLQQSEIIKSLQRAQGVESVRLLALIQQLLQDYFIDTASEASLAVREAGLRLRVKPGMTLTQRRDRIKKRMHGPGMMTKQSFLTEINEFYDCEINEVPRDYKVLTKIISKRGIPENIEEMSSLALASLPAHLQHEFIYTWLPWNEVQEVGLTWDGVHVFGSWGPFQTAFLK